MPTWALPGGFSFLRKAMVQRNTIAHASTDELSR